MLFVGVAGASGILGIFVGIGVGLGVGLGVGRGVGNAVGLCVSLCVGLGVGSEEVIFSIISLQVFPTMKHLRPL